MSKISLIISREYATRARKKSFIIMTILAPILMAALIIVPVLISIASEKREEASVIGVLDNSGFYSDSFVNTDKYTFISYDNTSVEDGTQQIINKTINYLVVIPKPADTAFPERVYIYGDKDINGNFESFVKNTPDGKIYRRRNRP